MAKSSSTYTIKQMPGEAFQFPCRHRVVLPQLGVSGVGAYWCKNPKNSRGGTWRCSLCIRKTITLRNRGLGAEGLHGWATKTLLRIKSQSERGGYAAPKISVEDLVDLRSRSQYCVLTDRLLVWSGKRLPSLHHNHDTGEVIGFVCSIANRIEGMLSRFSKRERAIFFRRAFPKEVDFGFDAE
jgi:hypothetical protein